MYDFEIAMPVDTGIKKIGQRLEDFKRHGLHNIGDLKVRLVLLAATAVAIYSPACWIPSGFCCT